MNRQKKKLRFKKNETGFHHEAVKVLARWVKGKREQVFNIEGYPAFVPDVTCYVNGITMYEVVYTHPVDGKKLGLIQYWSYRNATPVTVYEVTAEFILSQLQKPKFIETFNIHIIDYTL